MATAQQQPAPENAPQPAPSGMPIKKMLLIGIPLFLVQLVLVYVVIVKFVAAPPASATPSGGGEHGEPSAAHGEADAGQKIMMVKDLIVNPAGTNGTRFLLTTIGIEVSTGDALKELEAKDLQVRDVLNTILTSKELDDLVDVSRREELRGEIARLVSPLLSSGSLKHVYFSKFIVQ
jgi:flagellar FliL protein